MTFSTSVCGITSVLSNEEMTKIKVVHLQKLYNFVVQNFFNLNLFRISNCALNISRLALSGSG